MANFNWEQYEENPNNNFNWTDYEETPVNDMQNQFTEMQQQHPYLYKLAEALQGNKLLNKAGNVAGHINNVIEGTGLPSAARGFYQTGIEAGRGLANLIPGVSISKQELPELNINPLYGSLAELGGGLGMGGPLYKGFQASKAVVRGAPYLNQLPSFAKSLLAGGTYGAAISPDNRIAGGIIGAATSSIPSAVESFSKLKPNAYKAIQEGYDQKIKKASDIFENVGKIAEKKGIDKIPLDEKIIHEIKDLGPKKKSFSMLLDKARSGDYESLRKVQSELFKRAEKLKSSDFVSENDMGDKLHDLRNEINQSIYSHFSNSGHPEVAKTLQKGMGIYKQLIDTYHSIPQVAKLVGPNRLVPNKNTLLKQQSVNMQQLKMHHPEIQKQLSYEKKLRSAQYLGGLLGAGGILELYHKLSG